MTWLYDFDLWFATAVNNLLHGAGSFFTPLLKIITLSGNGGAIFIVVSVIMLLFNKTRKAGFISLFALILGVIITNLLLKNIVARPRPFTDTQSPFYDYWVQAGSLAESGYSFPSGHTTAATAFGMAIFLSFRKRYSWTVFIVPLIMGFSRIYFGVHYTSDVLAAIIVGLICGLLAFIITNLFMRNRIFKRFIEAKSITTIFCRKKENEDK